MLVISMPPAIPLTRDRIAARIERLINLLDQFDGDPDYEPETDCGPDDVGELSGETWLDRLPAREIAEGYGLRSEEHTSELQSLMRISYAVFCLKKKKQHHTQ